MRVKLLESYLRLLFSFVLFWPLFSVAAPEVVVSIKPVHSLVAGVMVGVATPELLDHKMQSPHSFTLAPSDVRKLNRADRVFWIGRSLEPSLAKVLGVVVDKTKVVALLPQPGMEILQQREGGVWGGHNHDEIDNVHGDHETSLLGDQRKPDSLQNANPHIWLSPFNASRIVTLVMAELSSIDPGNADSYRRNGESLLARISAMELEIGQRLSAVRDIPYFVFHDAYAYFEHHYQLNSAGSVALSPERMPGARRVHQLRSKIEALNARCVFSEPQFEPKLVRVLLEGTKARGGNLDPLGVGLSAGPDAYFLLINNLADALVDCLLQ